VLGDVAGSDVAGLTGRLAFAARWRATTTYAVIPAIIPTRIGTRMREAALRRFGTIVARSGPGFSWREGRPAGGMSECP
jgi:hypothetical protein